MIRVYTNEELTVKSTKRRRKDVPLGQKEREEDDQFNGQESVVREKRGKASRAQHTEGIKTQNGAKSEFAKRQRGASVSMVLLFARDPIQDLQGPGPGAWQAGGRRYCRASLVW